MNFKPIDNRIIIKLEKIEDTTPSGIVIPSTVTQEAPNEGIVMAVPDEVNHYGCGDCYPSFSFPSSIQVGDRVVFEKFSGIPVKIDGKEYVAVDKKHVIGYYIEEAKEEEVPF